MVKQGGLRLLDALDGFGFTIILIGDDWSKSSSFFLLKVIYIFRPLPLTSLNYCGLPRALSLFKRLSSSMGLRSLSGCP